MTFCDVLRANLGGCPGCCLTVTLLGITSSFLGVEMPEDCEEPPVFLGDCWDRLRLAEEGDMSLPWALPRLIIFDRGRPLRLPESSFCKCRSSNPTRTVTGVDGDGVEASLSSMLVVERAL